MSGEEDATREIFGYTSHIPVPTWVPSSAYSACHHCTQKFSSLKEQTKQHHCRLCGHMYCGSCTAKYHVPLVYEQKGKKGAVRVCIRCRDSCLQQKEKEKDTAAGAAGHSRHHALRTDDLARPTGTAAQRSTLMGGPGVLEITPPPWDDIAKYIDCRKCHKKGTKPHNCRTCGHLYCDDCTTKMVVPPCFERKAKSGPSRVCGECRFKILGGAKLVEQTTADTEAKLQASGSNGAGGSATQCIKVGCPNPRVSKAGYCAQHVNEAGGQVGDVAANASVSIRWEGEAAVLAKVAITDKSMSLLHIDVALKRAVPSLAQLPPGSFEYVYRNEGIADVFFDIFTAQTFAEECGSVTTISIRKIVDSDSLLANYTRQGPGRGGRVSHMPGQGGTLALNGAPPVQGITTVNNPFKMQPGQEKTLMTLKEKKEPKPKVVPVFRPPVSRKGYVPKANKPPPPIPGKGPPPLPGGAKAPPPLPANGGNGLPASDDTFKSRSKAHFGSV